MITIFIGKSGSGKDTFLRREARNGKKPVVSYTTRPMREGETDGVDYHFVTPAVFRLLEKDGKIVESRSYHTAVGGNEDIWYYGSPKLDPETDEYVAVVDVNGAYSYMSIYGADMLDIRLIEADDAVRERRAMKRGSFDKTEWDRRVKDDAVKFSENAIRRLEDAYGRIITRINNNKEEEIDEQSR